MKYTTALGIDAGGTYTDLVLLDQASGKIISRCKSQTTRPDPSEGIRRGLSALDSEWFRHITMVSLATTFATNAIVEEVGAEAGLILIGYDEIPGVIPHDTRVMMLQGGHTVSGTEKAPMDAERLSRELDSFALGLDAIAVAGFFSVRNPEHELRAAREIRKRFNLPVVRSHRLSMRLDAVKRATTAWWNARLIPLISNLILSCQRVLKDADINAPLMVVRGDGTLMSADTALDRPVDTLLSGPAASILGARHLAGVDDCLIVDMGGTTTDMAMLSGGRVMTDAQGARVGRWETHVEAAKVRTIGLGGDSIIQVNGKQGISVGPRRVIPLCLMAERTQQLTGLLAGIASRIKSSPCPGANPCSFYIETGRPNIGETSGSPTILSEYHLWGDKCNWTRSYELADQEKKGMYIRAALTPTDLRVAAGQFALGDPEVARMGRSVMAAHLGLTEKELSICVEDWISRHLCLESVAFVSGEDKEVFTSLSPRWYEHNSAGGGVDLDLQLTLTAPVVGVGAPAPSCLPQAFKHLNTQALLPEGYDISVAVGAVVGMVDLTFRGIIRLNQSGAYDVFTAQAHESRRNREEALEIGRQHLESLAREEMEKNFVPRPLIEFSTHDRYASASSGEQIYLETNLELRATGRPAVDNGT